MLISRLDSAGPWVLSLAGGGIALFADINWGGVATAISGVGMSIVGVGWLFHKKRHKAYQENESAKLKAFVEQENAKREQRRKDKAEEIRHQRQVAALQREIQRHQDEANKTSLTATLASTQATLAETVAALAMFKELCSVQVAINQGLKKEVEVLSTYTHEAKHESKNDAQKILTAVQTLGIRGQIPQEGPEPDANPPNPR